MSDLEAIVGLASSLALGLLTLLQILQKDMGWGIFFAFLSLITALTVFVKMITVEPYYRKIPIKDRMLCWFCQP
jgi:hypothetical protein